MDQQRLDELLTAHLRQEAAEDAATGEHLGCGALRRAGLGEPLRPEEESHLLSCPACARAREKFRTELRQKRAMRLWPLPGRLAPWVVPAAVLITAVGLAAGLVLLTLARHTPEEQLLASLPNQPVARIAAAEQEIPGLVQVTRGGAAIGDRSGAIDFAVVPGEPWEAPPVRDRFPSGGLRLYLDDQPRPEAGSQLPLRLPLPTDLQQHDSLTWRIEGGPAPVGGECTVLRGERLRLLESGERRLHASVRGRALLYGLLGLSARLERLLSTLPPDEARRLRVEAYRLWPGLPPPLR